MFAGLVGFRSAQPFSTRTIRSVLVSYVPGSVICDVLRTTTSVLCLCVSYSMRRDPHSLLPCASCTAKHVWRSWLGGYPFDSSIKPWKCSSRQADRVWAASVGHSWGKTATNHRMSCRPSC